MRVFRKNRQQAGQKESSRSGGPELEGRRKTREGDGTALGGAIAMGAYSSEAGTEPIGYFNPDCAPFRCFPNGKTALLQGALANPEVQGAVLLESAFAEALRDADGVDKGTTSEEEDAPLGEALLEHLLDERGMRESGEIAVGLAIK